jgi:hypothetical protein
MALLDEQLVEEWLNRQNFFTMRGIKCGVDEIDLLAIRPLPAGFECWHVEVQISYRPVGYIGGDRNARRRTPDELRAGDKPVKPNVIEFVDGLDFRGRQLRAFLVSPRDLRFTPLNSIQHTKPLALTSYLIVVTYKHQT